MPSLRFTRTNLVEASTVVLKNGTGGGAPARDEVTPYVMENAMNRERRVLWQNSGGINMDVDFDLTGGATNPTVGVGGIAGHRPIAGALTGITAFTLKYSTHANGYPPVAGSSWTTAPGMSAVSTGSARDKIGILSSTVAARYWRFELTVGTTFTLGKFVLGVLDDDLGVLYSPGASVLALTPHIENRTVGQDPIITYTGDDRLLVSFPYNSVPTAKRTILERLRALRKSFFMFDKNDTAFEMIVTRAELRSSIRFEQPSDTLFDLQLEMEQLG